MRRVTLDPSDLILNKFNRFLFITADKEFHCRFSVQYPPVLFLGPTMKRRRRRNEYKAEEIFTRDFPSDRHCSCLAVVLLNGHVSTSFLDCVGHYDLPLAHRHGSHRRVIPQDKRRHCCRAAPSFSWPE